MSSSPVSTSVKGLLAGRFSCPTGGIWATVIKKKKGKKRRFDGSVDFSNTGNKEKNIAHPCHLCNLLPAIFVTSEV